MKSNLIFRKMMQMSLMGLMILGIFFVANAQSDIEKNYSSKLSKIKKLLRSSTIDFKGGKLLVNSQIKQVDVSGGNDGCYTVTVKVLKKAPNGSLILVRSRSKQVCAEIDTPKMVFEDIPRSKIVVELEINRPEGLRDEKFKVDMNVVYPAKALDR